VHWLTEPIDLGSLSPAGPRGTVLCAQTAQLRPAPSSGAGPRAAAVVLVETPGFPVPSGGVPIVAGVEHELLSEGDELLVDGTQGHIELRGLIEVPVVTSFLERPDGRILLLHRSEKVGSFQGRWAAVSGFLEGVNPRERALQEIREETGLARERVELRAEGQVIWARAADRVYSVHPYRFRVADPEIRIDWEHTEYRWVHPEALGEYATVPRLYEAWRRVAPTPAGDQRSRT
jgi:8-oxo-dGTP diphosphatase